MSEWSRPESADNLAPTHASPSYVPLGELPPPVAQEPVVQEPEIRAPRVPPPGVKVALDLDRLEKEKVDEPYWFHYEGTYFELMPAEDADWQDLAVGQENPRLLLHVILGDDEQRAQFFDLKLPLWKLKKLVEDYSAHFGMSAPGEPVGSARS